MRVIQDRTKINKMERKQHKGYFANQSSRRMAAVVMYSMLISLFLALIPTPSYAWCSSTATTTTTTTPAKRAVLRSEASLSTSEPPGPRQEPQTYTMEISYEGRTCETKIRNGEPILSALERTGAADALALPCLPSDCRRGNCLTCVGVHTNGSNASNVVRGEDGLSPHMSKQAKKRGYILTCSSYVVGDGVRLSIGKNNNAWDELYRVRLEEETIQRAGREAMAKVIRRSAERNVLDWARETEETFRRSSE